MRTFSAPPDQILDCVRERAPESAELVRAIFEQIRHITDHKTAMVYPKPPGEVRSVPLVVTTEGRARRTGWVISRETHSGAMGVFRGPVLLFSYDNHTLYLQELRFRTGRPWWEALTDTLEKVIEDHRLTAEDETISISDREEVAR